MGSLCLHHAHLGQLIPDSSVFLLFPQGTFANEEVAYMGLFLSISLWDASLPVWKAAANFLCNLEKY